MTGNLNSIILEIKNSQKDIEDLKSFFCQKTVDETPIEVVVDRSAFATALQCSKTTKTEIIHEILLHFMQNPGKQTLEDVVKHLEKAIGDRVYAKNNPISNPNEEFRTHMNFKGEGGNTLLHQAVIDNNTQAIEILFNYDINPLIKNKEGKIPLDLTQTEYTRKVLVGGMVDQVKSKKQSARNSAVIGSVYGAVIGVGIGFGMYALAGLSIAIMLSTIAVSIFVAVIAVGSAIYCLSQDREQARAIEKAIKPSSVNNEVSHVLGNEDDKYPESIA